MIAACATICSTTLGSGRGALRFRRGFAKLTGFMMCTLTQRELDFLASLRTGWRLLYRRELMRLIRGDVEAGEVRPEARPISWRVGSG